MVQSYQTPKVNKNTGKFSPAPQLQPRKKIEKVDIAIPEEGREHSILPYSFNTKESSQIGKKALNILHKKQGVAKDEPKVSLSQSLKIELIEMTHDEEIKTKHHVSHSPDMLLSRDNQRSPSFTNIQSITETSNMESKASLLKRMQTSSKDMIAEKKRYDNTSEIIKSISGWKAFVYSYVPCLMKNSTTEAAFHLAQDDIFKRFDFVKMLDLMEDFQKLKRMVLTPDQLVLFTLVPGNKLSFTESSDEKTFKYLNHLDIVTGRDDNIENLTQNDIMSAFDRIYSQSTHSELDKNLLLILGFLLYGDEDQDSLGSKE